jgi:hypothetical protein
MTPARSLAAPSNFPRVTGQPAGRLCWDRAGRSHAQEPGVVTTVRIAGRLPGSMYPGVVPITDTGGRPASAAASVSVATRLVQETRQGPDSAASVRRNGPRV